MSYHNFEKETQKINHVIECLSECRDLLSNDGSTDTELLGIGKIIHYLIQDLENIWGSIGHSLYAKVTRHGFESTEVELSISEIIGKLGFIDNRTSFLGTSVNNEFDPLKHEQTK